jgi:hypothetical protein
MATDPLHTPTNGSELSGQLLDLWAHHDQIWIDLRRSGKSTYSAFV